MRIYLLVAFLNLLFTEAFVNVKNLLPSKKKICLFASGNQAEATEEVDVIVVGAGIGGLSCGALTSKYGFKTLCNNPFPALLNPVRG